MTSTLKKTITAIDKKINNNKYFILLMILLPIFDIFVYKKYSDVIYLLFLTGIIYTIKTYRVHWKKLLGACVLLTILYMASIIMKSPMLTEKAATWIYILLATTTLLFIKQNKLHKL